MTLIISWPAFQHKRSDMMRVAIFTDTFSGHKLTGLRNFRAINTMIFRKKQWPNSVFAPQHTAEDNFVANVNKMRSIPLTYYIPECRFSFLLPRIKTRTTFPLNWALSHCQHALSTWDFGGLYYAKKLNIPVVVLIILISMPILRFYKIEFLSNMLWKLFKMVS